MDTLGARFGGWLVLGIMLGCTQQAGPIRQEEKAATAAESLPAPPPLPAPTLTHESAAAGVQKACLSTDDALVEAARIVAPFEPTIAKAIESIDAADGALKAARDQAPNEPWPPTLTSVAPMKVKHVSGIYRGPFDEGGIVVESGGEYFLIENGTPPLIATILHGYVEDTGRTVTLSIGRAGRVAKVVTISSKETYDDDLRDHRDRVAEGLQKDREERLRYEQDRRRYLSALPLANKKTKDESARADKARGILLAETRAKFCPGAPAAKANSAVPTLKPQSPRSKPIGTPAKPSPPPQEVAPMRDLDEPPTAQAERKPAPSSVPVGIGLIERPSVNVESLPPEVFMMPGAPKE
ncbi:MAG: hypothetical protein IPM79_32495 [Polyangiaceae bacterium]|nr:hypothetical protein [Polyangiaceae bacterium]